MKTMKMITVAAAVIALAVTGCKKDTIDEPGTNNPGGRQFNVNMTDAPANFARMDITIDGVEAYHDSQGWINLSSETQAINVLSLANGNSTSLATASNVQTGHYSKIRLHFSDQNSVTVHAAVTIGSLFVAAGASTWMTWGGPSDRYVEIVIDKEISESAGAEVLIDFDAAASVSEGLNTYVINPALREMRNVATGARGTITGASGQAHVTLTDGSHTYTAYATASGVFLIRGVQPGTYVAEVWAPVRNEAGQMEQRRQQKSGIMVTNNTVVNIEAFNF